MGTSYLSVGDRIRAVHDLDLLVLIRMLLNRTSESAPQELDRYASAWNHVLESWGPGVVALDLDELAASEAAARAHLVGLFADVREQLIKFGDAIPLSYLLEGGAIPGVLHHADFPVRGVLQALDDISELALGDRRPDWS